MTINFSLFSGYDIYKEVFCKPARGRTAVLTSQICVGARGIAWAGQPHESKLASLVATVSLALAARVHRVFPSCCPTNGLQERVNRYSDNSYPAS